MANEPRWSNDWLLGVTLGGYAFLTIYMAFFFVSDYFCADVNPPRRPDPTALKFLLPGLLVALVVAVQASLERWLHRKVSDRMTRLFLWLSVIGVLGIGTGLTVQGELVAYAAYLIGLVCVPLSVLVALGNIGWGLFRGPRV